VELGTTIKTRRNRKAIRVGKLKSNKMEKQFVQLNLGNTTQKQYDQTWQELRKAGQSAPRGLVHHVALFQDNNCLVFDVWESRVAFDTFSKILMPILDKLDIRASQPRITPVYNEYSGVEAHATH
jgi:hypothetical protein